MVGKVNHVEWAMTVLVGGLFHFPHLYDYTLEDGRGLPSCNWFTGVLSNWSTGLILVDCLLSVASLHSAWLPVKRKPSSPLSVCTVFHHRGLNRKLLVGGFHLWHSLWHIDCWVENTPDFDTGLYFCRFRWLKNKAFLHYNDSSFPLFVLMCVRVAISLKKILPNMQL